MKTGWIAIGVALLLALAFWCWHPVCVPIPEEALGLFTPRPVEQRADERQWGVQTFQRRDGQWCQCKPWLAREMFF
jgi:hypothetical protein